MHRKHQVEFYVFSTGTTITTSIFFNTHSYLQSCFLILNTFFSVGISQSLHLSPPQLLLFLPPWLFFFFLILTKDIFSSVIFFYPPYFQGTLALEGSARVFCMPFSAICGSDTDFYKLCIAYDMTRILLHRFFGCPLNPRHLLQEYLNTTEKNYWWSFSIGRHGGSYPGVRELLTFIITWMSDSKCFQALWKSPCWRKADVSPSLRSGSDLDPPCMKWA